MDMTPQTWPDWYDGRHINEVLFCQQFLEKHPMKCVRGRLFTVDGLIEDEGQIGNLILEEISGVLTSGLSKVVTNLLASIKLQAYSPPLPIETDRIHVSNGTYFMDGSFTADKSYCNNRLTVVYNPDAPIPRKWLQFLSGLLQPEDIPTLQEFLGYCLLPTTKGQKSCEQQIELLQDFIREQFVADGMCADAAIHDTDGHNPHAHILLTVRPLDEQGKWQYKTEKEYLCMKNGEERGFTAAEFRTAKKRWMGEAIPLQGRQEEGVYGAVYCRGAGICSG